MKSSAGGLSLSYKFGRLDHREPENPDMGLQILSPSWERAEKLVAIQKPNARNGCILGLETRGSVLVFSGEAEEQKTQSLCAKSGGGHTKLCARGHWRPAEDAKLKDLVSRFGPQNWNLIAEHLQGRSGSGGSTSSIRESTGKLSMRKKRTGSWPLTRRTGTNGP